MCAQLEHFRARYFSVESNLAQGLSRESRLCKRVLVFKARSKERGSRESESLRYRCAWSPWQRLGHTPSSAQILAVFFPVRGYRPPGSPHSHMETLDVELERLSEGMVGMLCVGDINIWHKKWVKHSPTDILAGERLHLICKAHS